MHIIYIQCQWEKWDFLGRVQDPGSVTFMFMELFIELTKFNLNIFYPWCINSVDVFDSGFSDAIVNEIEN